MSQTSPEIETLYRVAFAINAAWNKIGDVPFPLYQQEADALAAAAIEAFSHAQCSKEQSTISAIHDALSAADLEYSGYSCNGVNVVGDRNSINKVATAFHSHSQIDWYQRNLRHWREECGKLHAKLAAVSDTSTDRASVNPVCDTQALLEIRDFLQDIVGGADLTERSRDAATGFVSILDAQFGKKWAASPVTSPERDGK